MQGVGHNVQIQDYAFVILKPIQTKIRSVSTLLFILWRLISWQGGGLSCTWILGVSQVWSRDGQYINIIVHRDIVSSR